MTKRESHGQNALLFRKQHEGEKAQERRVMRYSAIAGACRIPAPSNLEEMPGQTMLGCELFHSLEQTLSIPIERRL